VHNEAKSNDVPPKHVSSPNSKQNEKGKEQNDLVFGTLFWKERYCVVVPVLQNNIVDLELENQELKTQSKFMKELQCIT
jgi:hypothetical protein